MDPQKEHNDLHDKLEQDNAALKASVGELLTRVSELEKLVQVLHNEKLERDEEEDYSDDPDPEEASTEEEESDEEEEDVIPLVISVERVKRKRRN